MTVGTTRPGPGRRAVGRMLLAAAGFPGVLAALGALAILRWRDDLPAHVAIHWAADGTPDDVASARFVALLVAGIGVAFAVAGGILVWLARGDTLLARVLAGVTAGTSAFVTVLTVALVDGQRGLATASDADMPVSAVVTALAVAVAVAVLAAWLVPRVPGGDRPLPGSAPTLMVGPDERVMWTRSVATGSVSAAVLVVAVAVTVVSGVLVRQWWMVALGAALALLVAAMYSITVTVDRRGVTIRGGLGWPRLHTPIGEIDGASVVDVHPIRHFGGYGYRIAAFGPLRGASGFVLRGGRGLLVERSGGARTVVVVADATTAAGLLNGLLRQRPESPTSDHSV